VKNFKNIGDKLDDHLKIEYLKNNQISIKYDKTISNIEDIIFKIKEKGLEIEDIMTEDADLEDVFIKLTKNL
jgi:ABC-2 type transport system ATP-binding protein